MVTQSVDTCPKAEQVQISLLCQATVAKRLTIMCSLSRTTINLARRAIQRVHPSYSQTELDLAFVAYHYGTEMADRLSRYLENTQNLR